MTMPYPSSLGPQNQIKDAIEHWIYLQFVFDAFSRIDRLFNSSVPLPSESSANQDQGKQWQHEFRAELNLEARLDQTRHQLGPGVAPAMA